MKDKFNLFHHIYSFQHAEEKPLGKLCGKGEIAQNKQNSLSPFSSMFSMQYVS